MSATRVVLKISKNLKISSSSSSSSSDDDIRLFSEVVGKRAKISNYVTGIVIMYSDGDFKSHFRLSRCTIAVMYLLYFLIGNEI